MANKKRIIGAAVAVIAVLALMFALLGGAIRSTLADSSAGDPERVHYYRNDITINNFGPDVYAEAKAKVEAGEADSILDAIWHVDEKGNVTGIFRDRMYRDPALLGAIATDLLNREEIDGRLILGNRYDEFKNVDIGELADKLHQAFLLDYGFWDSTLANVLTYLKSGSVEVKELDGYTSSMYQLKDALLLNNGTYVPAVVVRNSTHTGGHAIVFDLGKAGVFKFRLECGFQPVDVHYWPVPPDTPPEDDTPPGEGEPELEPKDPDAGPQAQTGGKNPDYGGKNPQNENPDTTVQEQEPQSPASYTPPKPPVDDASTGTQSGSQTVDRDNGKTETHGGTDYTVVTGDGQNHTDLGQVQADPPAVEQPVQDDGVNQGDILPPE